MYHFNNIIHSDVCKASQTSEVSYILCSSFIAVFHILPSFFHSQTLVTLRVAHIVDMVP